MNSRDVATLTFVALGVFTATVAVRTVSLPLALLAAPSPGGARQALLITVSIIVPAVLSWLAINLIRNRAHYAAALFPAEADSASLNAREMATVGIALLGVFAVISSLPTFIQSLGETVPLLQVADRRFIIMTVAKVGGPAVGLLLGAVLIIFRQRFALALESKSPENLGE